MIKRLLPLEYNFELKNAMDYLFPKKIQEIETSAKRIFFLDAATYNNLGDLAIAYAMREYINDKKNDRIYIEIPEICILNYWKNLCEVIKHDDIICLSGGGNMGDYYPRYEAIRRKVIKKFHNNLIIIFPQTVDYTKSKYGKKEFMRSIRCYNEHPNLYICTREKKSYFLLKKYHGKTILMPDIVFYLYNKFTYKKNSNNSKVGVCLRDDKESALDNNQKASIIAQLNENNYKIEMLSTISEEKCKCLTYIERKEHVEKKLNEFSECELIITDRLHGMIFSLLTKTPCIIIDNLNKKVSGVYEMIKDNTEGIVFLESIDKFNEVMDKIGGQVFSFDNKLDFHILEKLIRGELL